MKTKEIDDLRRALSRRLAEAAAGIFPAVVTAVEAASRTCRVEAESGDYEGVRLFAVEDGRLRGLTVYPAVGSQVLVARIGGSNDLLVVSTGEVDAVEITRGDELSLRIDADGVSVAMGEARAAVTRDKVEAAHIAGAVTVDASGARMVSASGMTLGVSAQGVSMGGKNGGLKKTLSDLCEALSRLTVTIGTGASGTPVNAAEFAAINERLNEYLL